MKNAIFASILIMLVSNAAFANRMIIVIDPDTGDANPIIVIE